MVECFHTITIDAKRLHFRCEQYCIILPSKINRFLETLSSFCIFEKALFLDPQDSILETRDSILETRSSNVSSIEAWGSSLEARVSSVNLLLSGTVEPCDFSHLRPQFPRRLAWLAAKKSFAPTFASRLLVKHLDRLSLCLKCQIIWELESSSFTSKLSTKLEYSGHRRVGVY